MKVQKGVGMFPKDSRKKAESRTRGKEEELTDGTRNF